MTWTSGNQDRAAIDRHDSRGHPPIPRRAARRRHAAGAGASLRRPRAGRRVMQSSTSSTASPSECGRRTAPSSRSGTLGSTHPRRVTPPVASSAMDQRPASVIASSSPALSLPRARRERHRSLRAIGPVRLAGRSARRAHPAGRGVCPRLSVSSRHPPRRRVHCHRADRAGERAWPVVRLHGEHRSVRRGRPGDKWRRPRQYPSQPSSIRAATSGRATATTAPTSAARLRLRRRCARIIRPEPARYRSGRRSLRNASGAAGNCASSAATSRRFTSTVVKVADGPLRRCLQQKVGYEETVLGAGKSSRFTQILRKSS
jgi:hypothetical protein